MPAPMASTTGHTDSELAEPSPKPKTIPKSLARPLPLSPSTTLHVQTTSFETSNLIFLTTTTSTTTTNAPTSLSALGSFVYAMPNVRFLLLSPLTDNLTNTSATASEPKHNRTHLYSIVCTPLEHRFRHARRAHHRQAHGQTDVCRV